MPHFQLPALRVAAFLVVVGMALGCRPAVNARPSQQSQSTDEPVIREAGPFDQENDLDQDGQDLQWRKRYENALLSMKRGQFARAEKILDGLLKERNDDDALRNRGVCRAKLDRLEEALGDLDQVLARAPQDPAAHYNRGFVLGEQNRHREAIEAFSMALRFRPRLARAYISRGLAHSKLGEDREAIRDYTRGIEADPKMREAYLLRAEAHQRNFEFDRAREDVERAEALAP